MKTQQNIIVNRTNTILATITGAVLLATATVSANAGGLELRTADQEVEGTRHVEEGRIDKGIRVLETYMQVPYQRRHRGVYLTNLCAAYILKRDFSTAREYCDRGVEARTGSRDSFNNRGVLNALEGNLEAAMSDFAQAGSVNASSEGTSRNAVAQRNLVRVQAAFAARGDKDRAAVLADRVDP